MTAKKRTGHFALDRDVTVEICRMVTELCGNQFDERQFPMVENRLRNRMLRLRIYDSQEYMIYLQNNFKSESAVLLSLLTTHHTYFFREFTHFEHLLNDCFPKLIEVARSRSDKTLRIWSAACSYGHEVYSLAMFFDYHLKVLAPDITFAIFGSDIDENSIKIAENGVFKYDDLKASPALYLGNNWVRGTGEIKDFAKIIPQLREMCSFGVFNLVKPDASLSQKKFDVIFCRNVFIYLEPKQIGETTKFLIERMAETAYLFVGISESLSYMQVDVEYVGPSVYRRGAKRPPLENQSGGLTLAWTPSNKVLPIPVPVPEVDASSLSSPKASVGTNSKSAKSDKKLRVLCVDDSPSILTLLKKVLGSGSDFEIIGTAMNGVEAADKVKLLKPDVMTLDIHMPEMGGIEYLQAHMGPDHPPVVILSTNNRDNADVALRTLNLGAADYMEKPSLATLEDRGDELKAKLKTAFYAKKVGLTRVDKEFRRGYKITQPEKKLRVVFGGLQTRDRLANLARFQDQNSPPLIIVYEGVSELANTLAADIRSKSAAPVIVGLESITLRSGQIYIAEVGQYGKLITELLRVRPASIMICMGVTKLVKEVLLSRLGNQLVLEDLGDSNQEVYGKLLIQASNIVPITSFLSVSEEFLK